MEFNITEEQSSILGLKFSDFEILLIQALAGTGKTTTLIEIIKKNSDKFFQYLSFNNKIAEDFFNKTKNKSIFGNVNSSTIHSFALSYTKEKFENQGQELKNKLTVDMIQDIYPEDLKMFEIYSIIKWMTIYTNQELNFKDFSKYIKKISTQEKFKIKMHERKDYVLNIMKKVELIFNNIVEGKTDFYTHNVYLKYFIDNMDKFSYDNFQVLLIDEAQDLNPIMYNLIKILLQKNKKIICVGDDNQSIYSFMNNINILNKIHKDKISNKIVVKQLTKSFRFEHNSFIEKMANIILNHRGFEIEGVATYTEEELSKNNELLKLGRSNAQVLWECYQLSQQGKHYLLIGGLTEDIKEFFFDIYYIMIKETKKVKSKIFKSFNSFNELREFALSEQDQEILSAITLLKIIQKNELTLNEFFFNISKFNKNKFFVKARPEPTYLSTIHKAKGLEFDQVDLIPKINEKISLVGFKSVASIDDKSILKLNPASQVIEELNLIYVAVTRARKELNIYNEEIEISLDFLKNDFSKMKSFRLSTFDFERSKCTVEFDSLDFYLIIFGSNKFLINYEEFELFKKIITLNNN